MRSTSSSLSAADRLRTALDTLIKPQGSSAVRNATVTELCRRADISRHSVYRYHADILEELRTFQQRQNPTEAARADDDKALHAELIALRAQRSKLVALVDHYCLAFRESSALLARRDRELAELRRSAKSVPIALRRR